MGVPLEEETQSSFPAIGDDQEANGPVAEATTKSVHGKMKVDALYVPDP